MLSRLRGFRRAGLLVAALAVVVAIVLLVRGDLGESRRLLSESDWSRLPPAALLTALSYAAASAALVLLGPPMGVVAPARSMFRIAVLSIAVNNVISFGGVAGYTLRAALSRPHGVTAGRSLAVSLTHAYLNNLVMFVLLAGVLLRLGTDPELVASWRRTIAVAGALAAAFVVLSTATLFSSRVRRAVVGAIGRVALRLAPRHGPVVARGLEELDEALGQAGAAFRRRPLDMGLPVALLGLHWAAVASTFWACIHAFHEVGGWSVLSGFAVGTVAGFASLLPGGVGVQDGSQAAVLALRRVPLEAAVLGTLLFRLVYYVAPFLLTLPLYASTLRGQREQSAG